MKKITIIAAILALMAAPSAMAKKSKTTETPASDSRIEYVGRVLPSGNDISYDWSGVYARIRFNGPSLAMKCSDTKNCWFNLWIDKEMSPQADRVFLVGAKDTVIVLAEGLGKGTHEVILQKRTEGEQGKFTIHSFISEGDILQANGRKNRHIEFIGDSYTCGYGTESPSKDEPFKAETENCNLTYAAITARYFNADFNLVSHSGQGICRNYDNFKPGYNMPDRYSQVFDEDKTLSWTPDMGKHSPDMVVIYLGTNDFSVGCQPHVEFFADRYLELLGKIKANYGEDIPVLCMGSNCSAQTYDYVRYVCLKSGMKNIKFMAVGKGIHNETDELGASWHPNYKGHRKVASCVIPYVSTMTGWEMTEQPYK